MIKLSSASRRAAGCGPNRFFHVIRPSRFARKLPGPCCLCPSSGAAFHTAEVGREDCLLSSHGLGRNPVKQVDPASVTTTITMRSLPVLISLVGCTLAQGFNVQETVKSFPHVPELGRNVTTMHLSELRSTDEFTTLDHPKFPYHQVRVKKTKFCDPTVKFVFRSLGRDPA